MKTPTHPQTRTFFNAVHGATSSKNRFPWLLILTAAASASLKRMFPYASFAIGTCVATTLLSGLSAATSLAESGSVSPQFLRSRLRVRLSKLPMSFARQALTMLRKRSSLKSPSCVYGRSANDDRDGHLAGAFSCGCILMRFNAQQIRHIHRPEEKPGTINPRITPHKHTHLAKLRFPHEKKAHRIRPIRLHEGLWLQHIPQ